MKKLWIVCMIFMAAFAINANAKIYKWTDSNGKVHYTDTPPPKSIKNSKVISNKQNNRAQTPAKPAPAVDAPKGQQNLSQDELAEKRRMLEDVEQQRKKQAQAEAENNRLNCSIAKANYQTYKQGGRIYRMNENGEREYFDDEGLATALLQAQREMQQYCN